MYRILTPLSYIIVALACFIGGLVVNVNRAYNDHRLVEIHDMLDSSANRALVYANNNELDSAYFYSGKMHAAGEIIMLLRFNKPLKP